VATALPNSPVAGQASADRTRESASPTGTATGVDVPPTILALTTRHESGGPHVLPS
jgi:hypothetical protein